MKKSKLGRSFIVLFISMFDLVSVSRTRLVHLGVPGVRK